MEYTRSCTIALDKLISSVTNMIKAYLFHDIYKYRSEKVVPCLPRGKTRMKLITLYLPETYIKALDQLVNECFYPNRAEAIRVAIRDLISAEVWRKKGVD
jgi:antitoxin ParD1/3/4